MRLAVGCAALLTLGARIARAEAPPERPRCEGPSLVLEKSLDAKRSWAMAAGNTRRRVAELADIDTCTRVEVLAEERVVRVRASAPDGRSVMRELSSPRELESTVVALLVLPPSARNEPLDLTPDAPAQARPASESAPESTATRPAVSRPSPPTAPSTADRGPLDARRPSRILADHGFDLALGASGRGAGSLVGGGASVMIDWRRGGWLLGATARGEQLAATVPRAGEFSMLRSATLGAVFGRRLVERPFALELLAIVPALSVRTGKWKNDEQVTTPGQEAEPGELEPNDDDALQTSSRTVSREHATPARVDLGAGAIVRGVVPLSVGFGAFLAADAERTLVALPAARPTGEPRSPAWQAGVSLGVVWSPP